MKSLLKKLSLPPVLINSKLRGVAVFVSLTVIFGLVISFLYNIIIGSILMLFACIGIIYAFDMMNKIGDEQEEYINDLTYRIKRGERESLLEMPIGVILYQDDFKIDWVNPFLQPYFGDQDILNKNLEDVAPDLFKIIQANQDEEKSVEIVWKDHHFNLLVQKEYNSVYMTDITYYTDIQEKYESEKVAIGQIFLDNYTEVTQTMTDQSVSNLSNYVTNELTSWAKEYGIYLKQLDEDSYLSMIYADSLDKIEDNKFQILDKIRETTSKLNYPLTLSIGIAYGDQTLNDLSKQAQANLDLALGRGGDQVVVKATDQDARFYGGSTNPMEKRTRVRARMISQALREIFKDADQIFVQGHKRPDMDSLGAALGIRRIAQMNNKKCWIILDDEHLHSDVQRLKDEMVEDDAIKDSIITPDEALKKATDESLLVLVDHSNPDMGISRELYDRMENRLLVVDHHRRGENFPSNPILVYIEPYASSTSELITEMFEYQSQDSESINSLEATAMLAGIAVDTQSFSIRTGTRTFDAASYLRSAGADSDELQMYLKENYNDYMSRNHLVSMMEIINEDVGIITGEEDKTYDPVIAAQAADSMLNVDGIKSSYSITERGDGVVGISARSNGEVNVQLVMEKMGGGGHLSSGATQIKETPIAEVRQTLLSIINEDQKEESDTDNDTDES
ncbi:hypothetical protein GSH19_05300 [Lactobacillus sp. S2-2]|uniref:DHH family phosphoesterase n=1 Tax=Lactobacillus sp. S2-2 TaxID=2692917 RepID=UPI001F41D87D|nr:DHH family phosphoesterase [Lactobacillus sp. S2-2]MCF6515569.1 hypothetical protein [Lactobacillus sp. S2-2]